MKIFRVIGLGLLIITLKFLVPAMFSGLEDTFVLLFDTLQSALEVTNTTFQQASASLPTE